MRVSLLQRLVAWLASKISKVRMRSTREKKREKNSKILNAKLQ